MRDEQEKSKVRRDPKTQVQKPAPGQPTRSLSSAFLHQALLHDLFIQTIRELVAISAFITIESGRCAQTSALVFVKLALMLRRLQEESDTIDTNDGLLVHP